MYFWDAVPLLGVRVGRGRALVGFRNARRLRLPL